MLRASSVAVGISVLLVGVVLVGCVEGSHIRRDQPRRLSQGLCGSTERPGRSSTAQRVAIEGFPVLVLARKRSLDFRQRDHHRHRINRRLGDAVTQVKTLAGVLDSVQ